MKKFKNLILGLVCLTILSACGGNTAPQQAVNEVKEEVNDVKEEIEEEINDIAQEIQEAEEETKKEVTLLLAAAASLEYSFTDEIIPAFQEKYPHIKVDGTYDSSGKLQTQIEEGLGADIFFSAAKKQMNTLNEGGFMDDSTIIELLENKIALIVHKDSDAAISSFEDILNAETIALGDPESVPVGQYAQEALTSLGIYEDVSAKTSFGTNVTEVLNWVAEGSADAGIVYDTDALQNENVKVVAYAPDGSLSAKVIYPVGMLEESANPEEAKLFLEFLQSDEVKEIFKKYNFTPNI